MKPGRSQAEPLGHSVNLSKVRAVASTGAPCSCQAQLIHRGSGACMDISRSSR